MSLRDSARPHSISAVRLILLGRVQGMGIRPALFRLATRLGLAGQVGNTVRGVEVELEGEAAQVAAFSQQLPAALPPGAHLEGVLAEPLAVQGRIGFEIRRETTPGPVAARVPADLAVCAACAREVADPTDRRYRYPFTSCTLCGPRYSLLREMPYERGDTTMSEFSFCAACHQEYRDPANRRFHSQTQACPACGPRLRFVSSAVIRAAVSAAPDSAAPDSAAPDSAAPYSAAPDSVAPPEARILPGRAATFSDRSGPAALGDEALRASLQILRQGKILAIRGVGGYQLLVDATDANAVRRLRQRKHRLHKPLAVLVTSSDAAGQLAHLDATERRTLESPANPILLVRQRESRDPRLTPAVTALGFNSVGLMLPATPLHAQLASEFGQPLVCTSGNAEGDPLEFEPDAAERRLAGIADAWLHHDRGIARPIDDSVVRVIEGRPVTIRLARGLAPLSLDLPFTLDTGTLAAGGHMKAAAAWCNGRQAVLGPHVGDLDSPAARQRYVEQIFGWQQLFGFAVERLVHDFHPGYFTTLWSLPQAARRTAVQHHHAHVVAGMLEHGWLDREVLGVAWDGTGDGGDGSIWGGEFILATARIFRRWCHLRPFHLPGGEAAIQELWRTSLAVLEQVVGRERLDEIPLTSVSRAERHALLGILANPRFSPVTTSAGRLFDAAACLILGLREATFEGEAAMRLEAAVDPRETEAYSMRLVRGPVSELDWRPLFAELLADRRSGVAPGAMAARFHRGLARGIVAVCGTLKHLPAVLTGGVFQNRLLTEAIVQEWEVHPGRLGLPGHIPPNDGGLAAGQLAIALAQIDHPKQ